jgi:hypothetical protein
MIPAHSRNGPIMRRLALTCAPAIALMLAAASLPAQSGHVTTFIVVEGKDTVSLEQFSRVANRVSGVWINNLGQVQVHDFSLTLDADGLPVQYDMAVGLSNGSGTLPLGEAKYSLTFGTDSLTLTTGRTRPLTRRMAMPGGAFPTFGASMLGQELALVRMRAARIDSATIPFTGLSAGRASAIDRLPARFIGSDSAVVGTTRFKVDRAGHILGWHSADSVDGRRVDSIDVKRFVAGLLVADSLAEAAARTAQVVAVAPVALDKLTGSYTFNGTSFIVARDGIHLTLRVGAQQPFPLLPASATRFFMRQVRSGSSLEFEVDAGGTATAILIPAGMGAPAGATQRIPKVGN